MQNKRESSLIAQARTIMGSNFFGVEEAIKYFNINPSQKKLRVFEQIPWSKKKLEECKDTHILIAVFPISIIKMGKIVNKKDKKIFDDRWMAFSEFAKYKGRIGWELVRKDLIPGSNKKWDNMPSTSEEEINAKCLFIQEHKMEQGALLTQENEKLPAGQLVMYTMIGYFLKTGERLLEKSCVRCSDISDDGTTLYIGYFDSKEGIFLETTYNHDLVCEDGNCGVLGAKKK